MLQRNGSLPSAQWSVSRIARTLCVCFELTYIALLFWYHTEASCYCHPLPCVEFSAGYPLLPNHLTYRHTLLLVTAFQFFRKLAPLKGPLGSLAIWTDYGTVWIWYILILSLHLLLVLSRHLFQSDSLIIYFLITSILAKGTSYFTWWKCVIYMSFLHANIRSTVEEISHVAWNTKVRYHVYCSLH